MVIKIPQLHNFLTSIREKILEGTGCQSLPDWEISVQPLDNIEWSVVLSYLISANTLDETDFDKRLQQLTRSNKNSESVEKAIKAFNPFKNRYSCFYNETLKQVVKEFQINLKLNSFTKVSDKLEIISETLRCPVVSMGKVENIPEIRIYSKDTNQSHNVIILYSYEFRNEENKNWETVYTFLLNHQSGVKLKDNALLYFLKEAKMSRIEIHKIVSTVNERKHFLISLLTRERKNRDFQNIIPKLYKSAYVVLKLNEAGYETDPRTRGDDGLSALYHAVVLGNVEALNVLYFSAANNCVVHSECSYRNPDCFNLNNLLEIEKIFKDDLSKVERDPNYSKFKNTADGILGLNKFLIEVHEKIKNKNERNYYKSTDETTLYEACKRRDIILSVLDTYQEFFEPTQIKDKNLPSLYDYNHFKNYYNLIDMTTAIMFFDNIFLLKERLVLSDESQYSEIETSLLLSVISHAIFEKKAFQKMLQDVPIIRTVIMLDHLPVLCRQENKRKIEEFSRNLQDTIINKINVVTSLPENEIKSILKSQPEFKDFIQLTRLKEYIKTAVDVEVTDIKSVLVIERALQVIGEYIVLDKKTNNSLRRFLSLVLPGKVPLILRQLRHELSHLKSYMFKQKFECENDFSLFRSIQEEIRQIKLHFTPIFKIHNLNYQFLIIKMMQEHLVQIEELPLLYDSLALHPEKYYLNILEVLNSFRLWLLHKNSPAITKTLETVSCYVENDISREIYWSGDWENLKKNILYSLWPLKWIVEMLKECGKADIVLNADSVLNSFKKLECCNRNSDSSTKDIKYKTKNVVAECKDLLKLFSISPNWEIGNLKEVKSINQFFNILKGFYLSDEGKDEIRQEIPETIKQSVNFKEKLIKSIKDGFTLEIEEITSELNVSYLSNKKKNLVLKLYQEKSTKAIDLLETLDPILELEQIFSRNSVEKKKYEALCETMQFSDQSKRSLKRLVAGHNDKTPGNKLSYLLNRAQLLKKILIEENEEIYSTYIQHLWQKIILPTSRIHVVNTIVRHYVRDHQLQAAVEALLSDCMSIYANKPERHPWIKSSKLYCGINLRNVISHGSPLLECLCEFLDPEDLPSDMIQKILQLIESEDSIKAILELYEQVDNDYERLRSVINSKEEDEYIDIRNRIIKCVDWENYSKLLPQ